MAENGDQIWSQNRKFCDQTNFFLRLNLNFCDQIRSQNRKFCDQKVFCDPNPANQLCVFLGPTPRIMSDDRRSGHA